MTETAATAADPAHIVGAPVLIVVDIQGGADPPRGLAHRDPLHGRSHGACAPRARGHPAQPRERASPSSSFRRCTSRHSSTSAASSTAPRARTASRADRTPSWRPASTPSRASSSSRSAATRRSSERNSRSCSRPTRPRRCCSSAGSPTCACTTPPSTRTSTTTAFRVLTDCVGGSTQQAHDNALQAMHYLQRDALVTAEDVHGYIDSRIDDGLVRAGA